ncbi:hypothetical protein SAMN05443634_104325 [Chishuiella changwenlii]|uniref:Uncharacterized protein n=1 Tax=Chishuiella changwenlii TaxID=1434701 RepID=A0A1M6WID5_9FLAO|nr:hypothetical protein [Chishuiella changwenlii]GGF04695.1 hypothetical protein GCM10010984_22470 [Chishuiella changwenlii]SHK93533.1 hypothetical protein SAMN05443634_104325 [Chishuiella changwenlii]
MKKNILTIIIFISVFIKAQVIISTDSTYTSTSPKVALDVNGKDGGILLPNVKLTTLYPKIDIPKEGTVVFNTLEDVTNKNDSRVIGYYIFIENKWRLLLDKDRGLKHIPKRITYTQSTFDKNAKDSSGSLIITPESFGRIITNGNTNIESIVKPIIPLSEDESFKLGAKDSSSYNKWKKIKNFYSKISISSNFHKNNKLILTVDGPISFTNYNDAIATFAVGVFVHKLENDKIVESRLEGIRMYDMELQNICTSDKRTPAFLIEDLEEGEYTIEPVYRLIFSHDYKGGYSQSSTEDRWAYNYTGGKDDNLRRTRMFIGAPDDTDHYYTIYNGGSTINYDGSTRTRPAGECLNLSPFTHQSIIELIIYKKD